jgi:hypothetical protein
MAKPRKRKQHEHPKDASGQAVTFTGKEFWLSGGKPNSREFEIGGSAGGDFLLRRIWLGGISAQRGY